MNYQSFRSALSALEGTKRSGAWKVEFRPVFNHRFDEVFDLKLICVDTTGPGQVTDIASLPVEVLEIIAGLKRALKSWKDGETENFQP
jgi:hypothetical protein